MKNRIKDKLQEGQPVFGVWSIVPSPTLNEIMGLTGIDFQILDMEHGSYDFGSLESSIRSIENTGCSPLVRIAGPNACATQKALDFGAHGIIYPQVRDAKEAKQAIELTKYPPAGIRGFNPFTRVDQYSLGKSTGRNQNDFAMTGVIVENKSSAAQLDEILTIPQLEIVYLGSYDMSVALGKPGDMTNPELMAFMESSIRKIHTAGKVAGVMASSPEQAKKYHEMGARFIVMGVDSFLIGRALKNGLENFQNFIRN